MDEERKFWLDKLSGDRWPSGLRPDHRRPEARCEASATAVFEVAGGVFDALVKLSGGEPFLEYAALTATLTGCLFRYTQASPIVLGCPALKTDGEPGAPNAVVVAVEVDGQMTFRQLLLGARQTLLDAHEHQGYPLDQLVADLGLPATPGRSPLFDVSLAYRALHGDMPETGVDLALTFEREAGRLRGTIAYSPALFEPATVERLTEHLVRLLQTGLEDTGRPLADLDILTGAERRRLLVEWNDTAHDYPRDRCVHELFEEQAERAPESIALADGDRRLTYRELSERANRLAHHLQGLGVAANTPVGICMDRSAELVVAVLATLKAGGAYIPYDPTYPRERIAGMLEDVKLKVLLTREALLDRLPEHKPRVLCLDRDWETIALKPAEKPPRLSGPEDLCYIIFTSGSTGRPKAAAVYHRGWTNLLHWFVSELDVTPADKNLLMSSISFDITQRSLAMPLVRGGELHLVPDGYDPGLILRTVREQEITLLNCAPSTFYPLIETADGAASLRPLRWLILGGEAISASRLRSWATSPEHDTKIINVYGAAECSDVSSSYCLHDFDRYVETSVPIGRPIYNSRIYLVDEELRLVPTGIGGEICLAGDGVGKGYVNDAALTAKKLVEDPFADSTGEKGALLYRTGDLGRYLPDGTLEFIGRIDHQVKIRGLRIELGEIETLMRAHHGVKEAVAVATEAAPGDQRLTAYFVPDPTHGTDGLEDELRTALARKLPAYMVPNTLIKLDEMPLNPNGKIDRDALPAPRAGGRRKAGAAPRTPTEKAVAALFAEILKVQEVGIDDDFFRLGGHSLMATQMIARISETFNVRFQAAHFFIRPTVAALAQRIEASTPATIATGATGATGE